MHQGDRRFSKTKTTRKEGMRVSNEGPLRISPERPFVAITLRLVGKRAGTGTTYTLNPRSYGVSVYVPTGGRNRVKTPRPERRVKTA